MIDAYERPVCAGSVGEPPHDQLLVHHVRAGATSRNALCHRRRPRPRGGGRGCPSLPGPAGWRGPWIRARARRPRPPRPGDPTAHGRTALGAAATTAGLARRIARIARWINRARPAALVVDVSVEVAGWTRLMGVPIVVMALPGDRCRPRATIWATPRRRAARALAPGSAQHGPRPAALGRPHPPRRGPLALHRSAPAAALDGRHRLSSSSPGQRRYRVSGDDDLAAAARCHAGLGWEHTRTRRLVRRSPGPPLSAADVVVTHAGLGALADVAAAGRPAVVIARGPPARRAARDRRGTRRGRPGRHCGSTGPSATMAGAAGAGAPVGGVGLAALAHEGRRRRAHARSSSRWPA